LHYSTTRRLPRLSSEDRPDGYTPEGSAAGDRQTDRALKTVCSLPKRLATNKSATKAMTTKAYLQTITHGSSWGVLRQADSTQMTRQHFSTATIKTKTKFLGRVGSIQKGETSTWLSANESLGPHQNQQQLHVVSSNGDDSVFNSTYRT